MRGTQYSRTQRRAAARRKAKQRMSPLEVWRDQVARLRDTIARLEAAPAAGGEAWKAATVSYFRKRLKDLEAAKPAK